MDMLTLAEALGPTAGVVVVVFLFLKALKDRDNTLIQQSKARDDRFAKIIDHNSIAMEKNTEVTGSMLEVLRGMNGH